MKINGKITTGLGKGAFFLSQDFYKNSFKEKIGFVPFPGTLNVVVKEELLESVKDLKINYSNLIKGEGNFGSVRYIEAILNGLIKGAIVFPDKTTHDENYLEFIADTNLRNKLNLEDEDGVELEIVFK